MWFVPVAVVNRRLRVWLLLGLALALSACAGRAVDTGLSDAAVVVAATATISPANGGGGECADPALCATAASAAPTAVAAPGGVPEASPSPTPTAGPTATPLALLPAAEPCGVRLPVAIAADVAANEWSVPFLPDALIPEAVQPALDYFFRHPESSALVVYQLGYEGIGFYHHADMALPIASVGKLVHLVAYARAVESGTINPAQPVDPSHLDRYYLPGSDLGAHTRALRAYAGETIVLDDVAAMMMEYSANSATDYLHAMLGQAALEATVADLEMAGHTAPCAYLGQFLALSNPVAGRGTAADVAAYAADPAAFGRLSADLAHTYATDDIFRALADDSWARGNQPSFATQAAFASQLSVRGTAGSYAELLAKLLRGELAGPEATARMRAILEWPSDAFEANQARYAYVGYKNGTLPGVLTSVYYAQPLGAEQPVVLALFFSDLPQDVYRTWRRTLTHDALAHWLMSNPNAIHIMHVLRDNARATVEP